jgi:hypothetical protein
MATVVSQALPAVTLIVAVPENIGPQNTVPVEPVPVIIPAAVGLSVH